jgi:hypothetical protein
MDVKAAIVSTLLAVFIGQIALTERLVPTSHAGDKGAFSGSWVANGSKEILPLGKDRETALFKLSGHVNLKDNKIGKENEFWAKCIGFADSSTGSDIRCIWRSLDGEEIYLTLQSTRMEKGSRVTGKIVGGTGALAGITGYMHFSWASMTLAQANDEIRITGFSQDVEGSYQVP